MANQVKEQVYRVSTWETDTLGRASLTTIFNWLQDIAASHAVELHFGKDDLEHNNLFWVLSRIYCVMDNLPGWNDEVKVRTWTRGIDGLFALRDFEIISKDKRIGGATSSWLMLDLENHRPVRPANFEFLKNREYDHEMSLGRNAQKIQSIKEYTYLSPPVPVRYSDIDVNNHVNNVRYLQWAIDSYPLEYLVNNRIASAELNFLGESLSGDEIKVATCEPEEGRFVHSIIRNGDNREQCRAMITWKD